jgi:hypothetical protein
MAIAMMATLMGALAPRPVDAQGLIDRVKRAAEKAAEEARKAAEAKKAAEEAKKKAEQAAGKGSEQTQKTQPGPGRPPGTGQSSASPAAVATSPSTGAPKSSAKVESQVLLAMEPGQRQLDYDLSPKGGHAAAVFLRGSRQVVVLDGVESPRFDEIMTFGIRSKEGVVFSDDGSRYSSVGRVGQDYVYFVDGKEVARFPVATTNKPSFDGINLRLNGTTPPLFTSNSRHYYFSVQTMPSKVGAPPTVTFYIDGKPFPAASGIADFVVSPDGERIAYVAYELPDSNRRTLMIDGKPAPWRGDAPQFTGDSKRLVTQTMVAGGATEVQIDGKPWLRAPGIALHFAPVTDLIVAQVRANSQSPSGFLHIGNQRVPGSDFSQIGSNSGVWFSLDGKRWASSLITPAGSQVMMVDGKKGLDYQEAIGIGFTPDGRFVYMARVQGGRQLIVHGDQESDAYPSIFPLPYAIAAHSAGTANPGPGVSGSSLSAAMSVAIGGNHLGFMASRTSAMDGGVVVIDGKPTAAPQVSDLALSPDGSRYTYSLGLQLQKQVFVDGKAHTGMAVAALGGSPLPSVVFSPDSRHVAYTAVAADGQSRGISFNGRFIPWAPRAGIPANFITFTPDSRHVVWLAELPAVPGQGSRSAVYVDGIRAVEVTEPLLARKPLDESWWSLGGDGVLTVVAQDGNEIKRFRITPGTDTSVDTLAQMKAIQ